MADFSAYVFQGTKWFQLTNKWQGRRTRNFLDQRHHPWSFFVIVEYPYCKQRGANQRNRREVCKNCLKQSQDKTVIKIIFPFLNHFPLKFLHNFHNHGSLKTTFIKCFVFTEQNRLVYKILANHSIGELFKSVLVWASRGSLMIEKIANDHSTVFLLFCLLYSKKSCELPSFLSVNVADRARQAFKFDVSFLRFLFT